MTGLLSDRWLSRWLDAATWIMLLVVVLFAPGWLAAAAVVAAFFWTVSRAWVRERDLSGRH